MHRDRSGSGGDLAVRLFGHLEVAVDGERFKLATPRKSLQVLAYLLLHRGAPVSREYLAFLLYPDDEEEAARAKLRATLSELPKILPKPSDHYVSVETDKVAWNPDAKLWLDVDAFVAASSDRKRLVEAIDLYRGDLLPEVYDEWLDAIRERHRNTYLRCLTERASEARRNGNLALAIEAARKVLAVDPWREDVVRRILAMRYDGGDRAGALREYAEFVKRLRDELHAEPMPETVALAEGISRDQAPPSEDDDVDRLVTPEGSAMLPFVGRRGEMERLLEMWNRVASARGACAFVSGEPGIGKSRLTLEFAHAVEERGGRVLVGATSSTETVPYEGVVDAFRSAFPLVAGLKPSAALAVVATLLPELHARVTLPEIPRLDAQSERLRLFESLFRCIAELASPRPVLLVLEDIHWAQEASLELLQFLLRRIPGMRVMLVATYRDEETPRFHALSRLRREAAAAGAVQNIWLSRLSVNDLEELRATFPDVGDRSAEALLAVSNGNPLFLGQLVSDVRESEPLRPPESLQAVVGRRIDRLSENARTAAEIAACIGDRFSRDAVGEVSAWDDAALNDALDELLDRRIIREAGGRGFFEYAFSHQLIHGAIVEAIPPKHAAIRRRRIARVLEELYPERFPELSAMLAGHYEAAGDVPNAARCYLEAVRRSISIGALREARALCERALALGIESRARADLLLELVRIEARSGDREAQDAALSALERAASELNDPALERTALLHRIQFASLFGDLEGQERAVRALRSSVPNEATSWNVEAYLAEGRLAHIQGDLETADTAYHAALACSRVMADLPRTARVLCAVGHVNVLRGQLAAAEARYDEAGKLAAQAGDPLLEQEALNEGWALAYQRRDVDRCRSLSIQAIELAVKLADRPAEAKAHDHLGVSLAAGVPQASRARQHFEASARIYGESGNLTAVAPQLLNRAVLETRVGFVDRAVEFTKRAVELFEQTNNAQGRVAGLANLVYLLALTGEIPAAREAAEKSLKLARKYGFGLAEASIFENLAFAEATSGDFECAIELAETSLQLRRKSESVVWSSKTSADLAIWYARLANLPAARAAAERVLADDDAIRRGSDQPSYCYWAAAQVFHLEGRLREAERELERARRALQADAKDLEPEDRERFLALPWNVDITEAAQTGTWPDPPR